MKYFFTLSFLLLVTNGFAEIDSTNGSWNIRLRGDYGFIMAHRPALEPLQEEHVKGFEISLSHVSSGEKDWQSVFNYPDYGITIAVFDLGSPKQLGTGVAVYPFIDFPLGKNSSGSLHFRYGMGLGYVEKIFNAHDNYKNAAVGSHINGVIHFDLHFEKKIAKRSALELGAGITHFSNGSVSMPNLGINIATVNLAYRHSFGKNKLIVHHEVPKIDKIREIHVYAGGFYKKITPPLGNTYFNFVVSGMRFKPINYKSAWGIGADIFYDNSIAVRIDRNVANSSKEINNFRAGLYGAYHLTVGHLGLMFNVGFYLYNAYKDDGNVYDRICLRYYFKNSFVCANLKTHYARADFVEFGYGIRFK